MLLIVTCLSIQILNKRLLLNEALVSPHEQFDDSEDWNDETANGWQVFEEVGAVPGCCRAVWPELEPLVVITATSIILSKHRKVICNTVGKYSFCFRRKEEVIFEYVEAFKDIGADPHVFVPFNSDWREPNILLQLLTLMIERWNKIKAHSLTIQDKPAPAFH